MVAAVGEGRNQVEVAWFEVVYLVIVSNPTSPTSNQLQPGEWANDMVVLPLRIQLNEIYVQ